ncbi:MAG TPA: TetR/AcrR family transcriptional regulator [Anaeromyxobacteraceae bacterium]|nr:TetR/AcrR family transcriptional regulator [Anaeromyxobacteraceae bacterium]
MPGTREAIVAAARDLLLDEGLAAVTMRRVAERVGVSATALYRHYADKEALLAAAVADGARELARAFAEAARAGGAREALRETGRAYLRFAFEHPRDYQLLFMAWDELPVAAPRDPRRYGPALELLFQRVEACRAEGLIAQDEDALEVVMLCWSVVHGLASLWLAGGARGRMGEREYRRVCDAVLDRALQGVLRRPPRRS